MTPVTKLLTVAVGTVLLAATACAPSEGLSLQQQDLVDAVVAIELADEDRPSTVTEADSVCIGESIATAFSDERLDELGLDAETLTATAEENDDYLLVEQFEITDSEAEAVADAVYDCFDWRAYMLTSIVEGAGEDGVDLITPEEAECFGGQISDEGLRERVRLSMTVSEDSATARHSHYAQEAGDAFVACVDWREPLVELLLEEAVEDGQEWVTPETATCVVEHISDEAMSEIYQVDFGPTADFDPNSLLQQELLEGMFTCVEWRELAVESMFEEAAGYGEEWATPELATCLFGHVSDEAMLEMFQGDLDFEADFDPSTRLGQELIDAIFECIDVRSIMYEEMIAGGEMSPDEASCVVDSLSDSNLRLLFQAMGNPLLLLAALEALEADTAHCTAIT